MPLATLPLPWHLKHLPTPPREPRHVPEPLQLGHGNSASPPLTMWAAARCAACRSRYAASSPASIALTLSNSSSDIPSNGDGSEPFILTGRPTPISPDRAAAASI